MPRNGSGTYTLPAGNPVSPGTTIESSWANTTLSDIATELTNSLSRTGAGGMLAPFRVADGSLTTPGVSFLNETNSGIYRAGAGEWWSVVQGVRTTQFTVNGVALAAGKTLNVPGATTLGSTLNVTGQATFNSSLVVTGTILADQNGLFGNVTSIAGESRFYNVVVTNGLSLTNKLISGVATPVNDSDAATKGYVDSVAQGLDTKASVKVATTANISLSGLTTIDGVAVIAGDRVLVKNQAAESQNGIYIASAGAWTRSTDMNVWTEFPGAFVFVEEGTVNDNTGWVCTVSAGGTLGTTAVTWDQFSGAGQVVAGDGLTKSGNTLNVVTASASRIVVNPDSIDLAQSGVTPGTYKSVTVDAYGRATAGTNPTTLAGFGITDAYTIADIDTLFGSTQSAAASAAAAATSATNAANSASNASTSASSASDSATAAANSATAAAASYDDFDDRYLGPKSSPPSVDNDGNPLLTGALYFNTSVNELYVWTGSAWTQAAFTAGSFVTLAGVQTLTNKTIDGASNTLSNVNLASQVTGTLPVANGGTGLTSPGAAGNVLTSNGTAWTSAAPAGGGAWEEISSGYVINSSGLTLTWTANNYRIIKIYLNRLAVSVDASLAAQFGTSSSIITDTDYDNIGIIKTGSSAPGGYGSVDQSSMHLSAGQLIDREDIFSSYSPGNSFEITIPTPIFTTSAIASPQAWKCEGIFGVANSTTYPAYVMASGFLDKTTSEYIIEQIKIYAVGATFTASYSIIGLKI